MAYPQRASDRTERRIAYDAFISYSHAADGKLAPALQNALQRFAKPWYRLRALHLFRDQTSLSATPGLWPSIEAALKSSRYFLLLASPDAASSPWVQQEVGWWLEHKSPQTMLFALTEGEIVRQIGEPDFDWSLTTALPPILKGAFTEDPLWVDFRWAKGAEQLSTKNPEFQNALAALAAPLRNVPKETLIGEDVRQHRRTVLLARGAAAVLVVLLVTAVTAALFAFRERDRAEEQATIAHVRQLAAQSGSLAEDQLDLALLLGLEANRISDTPETRGAIATALGSSPHLTAYMRGDPESGRSLAFSPDGSLLTVARDGGIDVWNVDVGERVAPPLTGHYGAVLSVAFNPTDPNLVASAGDDGTIRFWDVSTPQSNDEPLSGHSDAVTSIAFSPDGRTLISGSDDGTVVVWDVAERRQAGQPLAAGDAVTSLVIAADGKTFAVGGGLDTIVIWDMASRSQVRVLSTGEPVSAISLAFSPTESTLLASGGYDGAVRLWDVATGEQLGLPMLGHRSVVSGLAFSEDGSTLASGGFDGTVRLWDVHTRQAIDAPLTGHGRVVGGVAFRPGSASRVLASSSEDGRMILWNVEDRHRLGSPGPELGVMGVAFPVQDLAFSPDETTLASTALGVNLWDVGQREHIETFGASLGDDLPGHLAFNPRDQRVIAVGRMDGSVGFWDSSTGEPIASPPAVHSKAVLDIAFNQDGTLMASASEDGTVHLWDATTMEPQGQPITGYGDEMSTIAFSPSDADLLAFGGTGNTVVLWDIGAERQRGEPLAGHEGRVQSVAFSPDGRLLVSASSDGTVRLWDPASGETLGQLPITQSSSVISVIFSPDGELVAAGDAGGSIHLWDVSSRQPLGAPLTGHASSVLTLAISPGGRTIASGGLDGQVMLWDVAFDSWRALSCNLADRNLSDEEWRHYLGSEPYRATCPSNGDGSEMIAGPRTEGGDTTTLDASREATPQ